MFDPTTLTLLAITDDVRDGIEGLVGRAVAAVRGGATMIQLRLKHADARELVEVARALLTALPPAVPLVIDDRLDVALAAGAAGVHLGTDDLPPHAARRLAPPGTIIGASVGNDAELPRAADADYVGIGPVYGTASKADAGDAIGPSELARLVRAAGRPAVGIGGIDASNAAAVVRAGAAGVAVIRAVFGAPEPEGAARGIRSAIGR